ncbi:DUF2088 domain-containing protein [Acidilutibacter cellobiosedens]|jgi:hypothetical protein|uniref:DUF2088 domain-containing protein n=1 Tax=Acidilutibacter cellobiosedens TaxID=2507161 RepID=A0A410QAN9_9FIRM|nr:lactate racemase domain-containing protein [Acidilutibacter cellobiosedens]QAT61082.1 DUF2088 domain-containing protein [Acidilutibacter cellobiosedens]
MNRLDFKIDFPSIIKMSDSVFIPKMYKVRQNFDTLKLSNFIEKLKGELTNKKDIMESLNGKKVCIALGSRGINNISSIATQIVKEVKQYGGEPFIIPAMGSHGGATPEGQKELLEGYGITEDKVGAPIISNLDVEFLGKTDEDIPVFTSKDALNADGVILVNRVKPHTAFHGDIESGLIKMSVIGMGKQKGAELCHKMGFNNFSEKLKNMSRIVFSHVPVVLGVAILENAYDETADIRALAPSEFFTEEPKLLKTAKSLMPQILLNNPDILIVDELGKDISGDGMDPNITGRFASDYVKSDFKVNRIVVLGLTKATDGNANGIGVADITTSRVLKDTDFTKGYINSITAAIPSTVRLPMVMPNDYEAIKTAIKTANNLDYDGRKSRIVRIKNTLSLKNIYVSESLIEDVKKNSKLEIISGPFDFEFDKENNLITGW